MSGSIQRFIKIKDKTVVNYVKTNGGQKYIECLGPIIF